jgi:hypothetical protein
MAHVLPKEMTNTGAVPKKILEVMNVDSLTRENVASHLQVLFILLCLTSMLEFLSAIVNRYLIKLASAQLPSQTQYLCSCQLNLCL